MSPVPVQCPLSLHTRSCGGVASDFSRDVIGRLLPPGGTMSLRLTWNPVSTHRECHGTSSQAIARAFRLPLRCSVHPRPGPSCDVPHRRGRRGPAASAGWRAGTRIALSLFRRGRLSVDPPARPTFTIRSTIELVGQREHLGLLAHRPWRYDCVHLLRVEAHGRLGSRFRPTSPEPRCPNVSVESQRSLFRYDMEQVRRACP